MNEVLINIKGWNTGVNERFKNKDLITLEELLNDYEDLISDYKNLEEELNDMKTYKEDDFDEARADDYRHGLL